ncbi:zinc ribbon domain-containing protein YjdM [Limnobaculum parvum]|uniref:Alkylphosphonate utilization protein n=1 Tax=Limnobaculum parvum TaxID=2172103 RepID=A0A2Y9TYQ9_9GAMM|nr:zinc ribbon domain-containing protein YjdM [Limnobaculum parvum]AWH88752.1 alkylphosphonate utilization protein [Limnobaculum parvum]
MNSIPACPVCSSENTYPDGDMFICPDCAHEWNSSEPVSADGDVRVVKDSNGNVLADGDCVTLIKDLKLKGSSTVLKVGSKSKPIRLVDGDHEIDCKIDNTSIMLKACFVKKV